MLKAKALSGVQTPAGKMSQAIIQADPLTRLTLGSPDLSTQNAPDTTTGKGGTLARNGKTATIPVGPGQNSTVSPIEEGIMTFRGVLGRLINQGVRGGTITPVGPIGATIVTMVVTAKAVDNVRLKTVCAVKLRRLRLRVP